MVWNPLFSGLNHNKDDYSVANQLLDHPRNSYRTLCYLVKVEAGRKFSERAVPVELLRLDMCKDRREGRDPLYSTACGRMC